MMNDPMLFSLLDLPRFPRIEEKSFKSLKHPVWSEEKANLIREYIRHFTYVTKHGAYIDGFAAPQRRNMSEICSARLVLENDPKWITRFWLCDIDPHGVTLLNEIAAANQFKGRRIKVVAGDFNVTVSDILSSGDITAKKATFALLDQRTFECAWETVERLASFKPSLDPEATKIEIFYFLATGWLDRSIAAVKRPETAAKLDRWWGKSDWRELQGMDSIARANLLVARFKQELGYKYVHPYAIHSRIRGGRTMYHMIHATDHPEASPLMLRAYRKVSGRSDLDEAATQMDMDAWWKEVE
ncbi:three-Cys-motif partner protein TcmP [Azospirillum sp. TSO5]|uniref:three-Cys-motif partner protein TcmP n=1 Tax=Azospirillum sp. TSO5 TaxID=716760 RepID=UPI000D659DD2|nr:three-Cys-motif partner protein TcmP [Azospirillum sp. TSO5]